MEDLVLLLTVLMVEQVVEDAAVTLAETHMELLVKHIQVLAVEAVAIKPLALAVVQV